MSNKTSGFKRAIGIVLGVITMLVLIALFVVLVMAPIPNIWVDKVTASDNAIDQTVSPTQSETYCPAPIGLADTGTYGDSAFQATVGIPVCCRPQLAPAPSAPSHHGPMMAM